MQPKTDYSLRLKHDPELRYNVRAEQIFMAARGSPANLLSGIAAGLLLAAGATFPGGNSDRIIVATIWFGLLTSCLLVGVYLARLMIRRLPDAKYAHKIGPLFVMCGAVAAVIWGAAAWVLMPAPSPENETFVMVGAAMILVGGAAAQASYRPLVQGFTVTLTMTFSFGLVRLQEDFYFLYAGAFALLCLVTIMASRNLERALRDQIMFRMERDSLTHAAEEAREQSEAARRDAEAAREQSEAARRDAEAAREQSEEARREAELANRAKTVFLTAASHDLRQPMHALGLYIDSLHKNNEDPQLRHQLGLCSRSLDTLKALLDSMLDISRISAGTIKPVLNRVRMNTLLDRLEAQLRPLALDKRLYFDVVRTPAYVYTDDGLLERILVNLTQNAIRYTINGRIVVRCSVRGRYLRCHVFDTGIGIPADELKNIYEPFYQVANAARNRRKGLGMGLAIVRQLCDVLGYEIRVRSVVGKGSVFAVDVPIAEEGAGAVPAPDEHAIPPRDFVRGAFIVVVDNDEEDLHATTSTLREFGCRVLGVASSQSAVAKLQGKEVAPDLILADYRLEGETGLTAITVITDNLRAAYGDEFWIPAIVVSGDTSADVLADVSDQACPMLHKPVRRDELWTTMNNVLASKNVEAAL